jgi:hypothetical protein
VLGCLKDCAKNHWVHTARHLSLKASRRPSGGGTWGTTFCSGLTRSRTCSARRAGSRSWAASGNLHMAQPSGQQVTLKPPIAVLYVEVQGQLAGPVTDGRVMVGEADRRPWPQYENLGPSASTGLEKGGEQGRGRAGACICVLLSSSRRPSLKEEASYKNALCKKEKTSGTITYAICQVREKLGPGGIVMPWRVRRPPDKGHVGRTPGFCKRFNAVVPRIQ